MIGTDQIQFGGARFVCFLFWVFRLFLSSDYWVVDLINFDDHHLFFQIMEIDMILHVFNLISYQKKIDFFN